MQNNHMSRSILQEISSNRTVENGCRIPPPLMFGQMSQSQASQSSHQSTHHSSKICSNRIVEYGANRRIPTPLLFGQMSQSQASQCTHRSVELPTSDDTFIIGSRMPSHARRVRNGSRKGRGTVKGFNMIKKRKAVDDAKLSIIFSKRLGGAVGINRRAFTDDIVVNMRQNAPLVGVEKWSKVSPTCKLAIKEQILNKWDLEDNKENVDKIYKIAGERY